MESPQSAQKRRPVTMTTEQCCRPADLVVWALTLWTSLDAGRVCQADQAAMSVILEAAGEPRGTFSDANQNVNAITGKGDQILPLSGPDGFPKSRCALHQTHAPSSVGTVPRKRSVAGPIRIWLPPARRGGAEATGPASITQLPLTQGRIVPSLPP